MIITGKPKGVSSIRSISGLVTETTHPHRKFLKLAILAMEEARRGKEKASAKRRIDDIDSRLLEIRKESASILQLCNDIVNTDTVSTAQKQGASCQTKGGFTLKY